MPIGRPIDVRKKKEMGKEKKLKKQLRRLSFLQQQPAPNLEIFLSINPMTLLAFRGPKASQIEH